MEVLALACLAAIAVLALAGAYYDVISFVLPNWLTGAVGAIFLPFILVMYISGAVSPTTIAFSVLAAAVIFAVGVGAFALGLFGGGDVKYLAAAALWAWPVGLMQFLFVTSCAGAVVAIAYLVAPRLGSAANADGPGGKGARAKLSRPMPYGVAISAGLFYAVALWVERVRG